MTIQYTEYPESNLIEITVDGKVSESDYNRIIPKITAFIEKSNGKIKVLEIIQNFEGFDWSVIGKGIKYDMKHMKDISHCAVMCDSSVVGVFARMADSIFSCEIRSFKMFEEAEARAWLGQTQIKVA